jgi:hypothetical protein
VQFQRCDRTVSVTIPSVTMVCGGFPAAQRLKSLVATIAEKRDRQRVAERVIVAIPGP